MPAYLGLTIFRLGCLVVWQLLIGKKQSGLKQFHPKIIFSPPQPRRTIHPFRWFRCELTSLGDISYRGACLLLNIVQLDGTFLVVLSTKRIHLKNSNYDPFLKIIHKPVSYRNFFMFYRTERNKSIHG